MSMNKIEKYQDFFDNEEIKDIKRSTIKNSDEYHSFPKNSKFRYNKVTRKIDDMTLDVIDDLIEEKRMITDYDINIMISSAFASSTTTLRDELRAAIKNVIQPILIKHDYEFL